MSTPDRLPFRLRRVALWLAGIVAFVAIVGFVVAPPIVRWQAEKVLTRELGRTTTIKRLAINPFVPSITVTGFNVREADASQPFVTFDELYVRASYTSLLRLAPVIDAVRLTRPHVRIVRTVDRFNFSDIQARLASAPKPEQPSAPARFAVYNVEVVDGRLDADDRVVGRRLELADVDLGLPFLSSLDVHRTVFVEPRLSATVNGARIAARAKSTPFSEAHESVLHVDLKGFDVAPFVAYSPVDLPLRLTSARLDLDLSVTFAQPPGRRPSVVVAGRSALKSVAADFPDGGPMLRLASVAAGLAAIEPLAGRYEIAEVSVEAPEVWVRRDPEGQFALARLFDVPAPAQHAGPTPAPAPTGPLTYRLDAVSVHGGLVHWLDERGSRPIELELRDLHVALRNVSSAPGSRLTFEAGGTTDGGESLGLTGEAGLVPLEVAGALRIGGLALPRVWPLAERFVAAELRSGRLDAGTRFRYRSTDAGPHLVLDDIEATVADITMRQPGATRDFLRLARLDLRGGAFDLVARRASLGETRSKGLRLEAVRGRDGGIDLEAVLPSATSGPAGPSAPSGADKPFLVVLTRATIDDYGIRVLDLTRPEPFTWSLESLAATVDNFSSAPGSTATVSVKATVNGKGTVTATGSVGILPFSARLRVDTRALDIAPLQRFIDDQVNVSISSGALSTRGSLRVDLSPGRPPGAAYAGELHLADVVVVDKASEQDLLTWKSLFVGGVDLELDPMKVRVGEVALADFYSRLIVNADGTLNLQNVLARDGRAGISTTAPTTAAAAPSTGASAASAAKGLPADIRIGKVTLQGGNVDFSDYFIKPNFSANLTGIGGSVTEMAPEVTADLELRGKLDHTAPVEIAGRVNALSKDLLLDVRASARDIELPPLSPYSAKYAGYGIEKGKLSLTVKYLVDHRKLTAENKIHLDQLTFGERVESPTATQLPVLLAVALLKDRHGVIDIDLPISGSLDDPEFSVGGLIVRVIVNLLTKIVTAPFTALASAFGGGEELSHVEYAAGSATLDDESRRRLDALAKALNDRPSLKIEVAGRADAATDPDGLRRAYVDSRVRAEKTRRLPRDGKPPVAIDDVTIEAAEYPALLEAAYRKETFAKPRSAVGAVKDLPVEEMEKLMLAHAQVSDADLRELANRRARVAKDYLVETGKVPAERVFLVNPKAGGDVAAGNGKPARAEFALR